MQTLFLDVLYFNGIIFIKKYSNGIERVGMLEGSYVLMLACTVTTVFFSCLK